MKDVVIVGALRTPIGCFRGALAGHSAVELGSLVVKALLERTGVAAHAVDEVILGQVLTAGAGQNPARQSAIKGGLPNSVSAMIIILALPLRIWPASMVSVVSCKTLMPLVHNKKRGRLLMPDDLRMR